MSRLELEASPPPHDPANEIEDLAWFCFPVTWHYLGGSHPSPEPVLRIKPLSVSALGMTLVSPPASLPLPQTNAIDIATSGEGSALRGARSQWEMVIPKMVRPTAAPVLDRIATVTAPAPVSVPPVSVENAIDGAPTQYSAPALALSEQSRFARSWRLIALLAIISISIGFTLWVRPDAATQRRNQVDVAINRGGWSRRSILPQGRMMSVYEPSRDESDYRIEFGWVPDSKGVGWVFRTRDAGDYYATRISVLQPGARIILVVEHFSVFGGVEGAHSRRLVPLGNSGGLVRVRMDAMGPAFNLSLQGSAADYWTDARLGSGALGFYDERGQRPEVQSLRFTFVKKGAAQTAAATLP